MIRVTFAIAMIAAIAVAVVALAGDAGRASLIWLGWRADMTAAAAMLLGLFATLMLALVWRLLFWILDAPRRAARARADQRRRQAAEALTRGFVAAAAGDGGEARRLAQKAADLGEDSPTLVRLLAAQAAEAAGDAAAAEIAYTAMLGFPDLRLVGRRGLMTGALARGEADAALVHAEAAFALAGAAPWAWRALLDARLAAADWSRALALVDNALDRKIIAPITAERARAALLAASAAELEAAEDPRDRSRALDQALQAAKLQPAFAPGVVMAARLLAADGKLPRAAALIEGAWRAAAHPALWLAYRDLRVDEHPPERAARLAALAALNPQARESRILKVEQALIAGDAAGARVAAEALAQDPPTARLAGLMARVALAAGQNDEARAWTARGLGAAQEPDWSDLDPEGRAFAYAAPDWARLIVTYAESGALIHPRHERRERTMSDLPELPASYVDSAPFFRTGSAEGLGPVLDDPGYEEDAAVAASRAAPTGGGSRGRGLARSRRAAK